MILTSKLQLKNSQKGIIIANCNCSLLARMVSLLVFYLKVNKRFLSIICDQIHAQNIPNDTVTMFFSVKAACLCPKNVSS